MNESKAAKEPRAAKEPKATKGPDTSTRPSQQKGPHDLRIPSPLSAELDQLVYDIIGAAMRVHSAYGPGLRENVYEDAYAIELERQHIPFARQVPIEMQNEGRMVRRFRVDLVVANQVIVELKTCARLHPVHSSQMLTYLRITQLPVGIILNFHERHLRDGIRRHVLRPRVFDTKGG